MLNVDKEARKQLKFVIRRKLTHDHAYRMKAVAVAQTRTDYQGVYKEHRVSGSTFYLWRCEYVITEYAKRLEDELAVAQAALRQKETENRALRVMVQKACKPVTAHNLTAQSRCPVGLDDMVAQTPAGELAVLESQLRMMAGQVRGLQKKLPAYGH